MCTVKCAATESAMLHIALRPLFEVRPQHKPKFEFDHVEFPTLESFTAAMNYLSWQGRPGLSRLLSEAVVKD